MFSSYSMVNDTGAVSVLYNCMVKTTKSFCGYILKGRTETYISDSLCEYNYRYR